MKSKKKNKPLVHDDGSVCLEGTRRVPARYKPCCRAFDRLTTNCKFDIRAEWWAGRRKWYVLLCDGGSSGLELNYCPFCGKKLPGRLWKQDNARTIAV